MKVGGEGDDRGWDGWMASPTQWTWVWVNSGSWCWTGKPGGLQFMGLQTVGHDWVTELQRIILFEFFLFPELALYCCNFPLLLHPIDFVMFFFNFHLSSCMFLFILCVLHWLNSCSVTFCLVSTHLWYFQFSCCSGFLVANHFLLWF